RLVIFLTAAGIAASVARRAAGRTGRPGRRVRARWRRRALGDVDGRHRARAARARTVIGVGRAAVARPRSGAATRAHAYEQRIDGARTGLEHDASELERAGLREPVCLLEALHSRRRSAVPRIAGADGPRPAIAERLEVSLELPDIGPGAVRGRKRAIGG